MRKLMVGLTAGFAFVLAGAMPAAAQGTHLSATATTSPSQKTDAQELTATTTATSTAASETATGTSPAVGPVDVLQVDGLFDEIIVSAIEDAVQRGEDADSQALVLQVNSQGAVVDNARMAEVLNTIRDSQLPVAVWVGPSGSRLTGTPAQLLAVADVSGMAPGATVGFVGDSVDPAITLGPGLLALRNRTVGLSEARELDVFQQRISDEGIATIANMIDALDGYESNGVVLDTTSEATTDAGVVQRETIAVTRLFKLNLIDQMFHTVASPEVAYLLLLTGLALIVFEFFTAGVGIAAVVGAGCTVLAATGLAALPTRPWAVIAIVLAMLAFAVDVQVGIPRFWTGVGLVLTTIASFGLFQSVGGTSLRPSWIALGTGIIGIALTFIVGMPSMTRTRFSTPTIGREWMIDSTGEAATAVDPEGIVRVEGAEWRARTNRATPIGRGEPMRVIGIDGVTLQVEPLEGAARDYREMRGGHGDDETTPEAGETPAESVSDPADA